jgi:hypothetical protein
MIAPRNLASTDVARWQRIAEPTPDQRSARSSCDLGLGQVLRYRWMLGREHPNVSAVLVAEHEPRDPSWRLLCTDLGVTLVTPADTDTLTTELKGTPDPRG